MITLWVAIAGGLGAWSRFILDGALRARTTDAFPWATLFVNVTGSLLLGVITGLALRHQLSTDLLLVLGTGFCGGYTTFSAASYESVRLVQRGSTWLAVGYTGGTIILTMGAAAFGLVVTR